MAKVWTEQEELRAARKAILSAVGGNPLDEKESGELTLLLDAHSLHRHWGNIEWSISVALTKCYGARILDSNADWSRKILIEIPASEKAKFMHDLGEIQRAHRAEDSAQHL